MKFVALGTSAVLLSGCSDKKTPTPIQDSLKSDGTWEVYSPKKYIPGLFQLAFGQGSVFIKIRSIVTVVAIVAMALSGLKLIMSENPREVQIARTWLISIFVGLVLFWFIPTFFSADQLNSWFPK